MINSDHSGFDPEETGVYACRVPSEARPLVEDFFLLWIDGKWWYPYSDVSYRGTVLGWVGPLPRTPKIIGA